MKGVKDFGKKFILYKKEYHYKEKEGELLLGRTM